MSATQSILAPRILVLMAIVTTLMASPMFEWVYGRKARERGDLGGLDAAEDDLAARAVPASKT